jgi:hypothetical protein
MIRLTSGASPTVGLTGSNCSTEMFGSQKGSCELTHVVFPSPNPALVGPKERRAVQIVSLYCRLAPYLFIHTRMDGRLVHSWDKMCVRLFIPSVFNNLMFEFQGVLIGDYEVGKVRFRRIEAPLSVSSYITLISPLYGQTSLISAYGTREPLVRGECPSLGHSGILTNHVHRTHRFLEVSIFVCPVRQTSG